MFAWLWERIVKTRDILITSAVVIAVGLFFSFDRDWDVEENVGLWWLFTQRGEVAPPPEAFVINVDDISEASGLPKEIYVRGYVCDLRPTNRVRSFTGPIPRCLLAYLLERIASAGPDAIAIDISFEKMGNEKEDQLLASQMRDFGGVVVLRRIKSRLFTSEEHLMQELHYIIPAIEDAIFASGPFPIPTRPDRVNQFWTSHVLFGDMATLPTLALLAPHRKLLFNNARGPDAEEAISDFLRERTLMPIGNLDQLTRLDEAAQRTISLLRHNESHYLNYYGGPGTIPVQDAFALLAADDFPDLTGKTVFIGQVHLDTYQQTDRFSTVFSQENGIDLSGVEIAATAFLNLRHQSTLQPTTPLVSTIIIIGMGLMLSLLVTRIPLYVSVPTVAGVAWIYTVIALSLFSGWQIWIPTITIYIMAAFAILLGTLFQYELSNIWNMLWVPGDERAKMHTQRDPKSKPDQADALCLKCDIEDSTTATALSSQSSLYGGMDDYISEAGRLVKAAGGTFINPADDSFKAIWRIPLKKGKHWEAVVKSVFELSTLALHVDGPDGPIARRNRIGLSYGPISIGGMGMEGQRAFNAQGQPVILAARLEALNKDLNTRILATADLAPFLVGAELQDRGEHRLQGFSEPVHVIEVQKRG